MSSRKTPPGGSLPQKGADHPSEKTDETVLVITPALVAILLNAEREKGVFLTESEVIELRDNAACIAMTRSDAKKIEEARGYLDIDPENAWNEWQAFREDYSTPEN